MMLTNVIINNKYTLYLKISDQLLDIIFKCKINNAVGSRVKFRTNLVLINDCISCNELYMKLIVNKVFGNGYY